MTLFSQRNGIRSKIISPEEVPDGVRNRIWNLTEITLNSARVNNRRNILIRKIWSDFFKKSNSGLQGLVPYE